MNAAAPTVRFPAAARFHTEWGMPMDSISMHICTEEDLDHLATLNKQLIEDERHDNPMNTEQLKERMKGFLRTDYKAYKFIRDGEIVGYALVNHARQPLYLRHFFICREHRRKGYGTAAFRLLMNHLNTDAIDVEVMVWNERGHRFWQSLGFKERSVFLRLDGKAHDRDRLAEGSLSCLRTDQNGQ